VQNIAGDVMLKSEFYIARAFKLEAAAKQASDPKTRAVLIELAQRFHEMANLASGGNSKGDDGVKLTARMVGKTAGQH
jgi:hypothetical protein